MAWIHSWAASAVMYTHPRVISMLFFGFASGLPFLLTSSTLIQWLTEAGVSKTTIGSVISLTGLPYTIKFLFAPVVEKYPLPILSLLGQRRSWLFLSQTGLMISLIALSYTNPSLSLWQTAACGMAVSFCAAIQDTTLGGYRVEILSKDQYGVGAGAMTVGFRIGLFCAGSVALYLSHHFSWHTVYFMMGILVFIGMMTVLQNPEPTIRRKMNHRILVIIKIIGRNLIWKNYSRFFWVIAYIFLFKTSDTIFNAFTWRFLNELGFHKIHVAYATSIGFPAMMVGGLIGGILATRFGVIYGLIITACLQAASALFFLMQAMAGPFYGMMVFNIVFENFICGVASACIYTFFAMLCRTRYPVIEYALLTSISTMCRLVLAFLGGIYADATSWDIFFGTATFMALISIVFLKKLQYRL